MFFVYFSFFMGGFMKKILKKAGYLLAAAALVEVSSSFASGSVAFELNKSDAICCNLHGTFTDVHDAFGDFPFMGLVPKDKYNSVFQDEGGIQQLHPLAHHFGETNVTLSDAETLDLRNCVIEVAKGNALATAKKIMLHTLVKAEKLVISDRLGRSIAVNARSNGDAFFVEGSADFTDNGVNLEVTACGAESISR
jgi:hypothetical protein